LLLAVVLLTAVGLSACSAASPRSSTLTYRAHGVSFNHPAGWREQVGYTTTRGGGAKLWGIAVGSGTPHDLIVVQAYRVSPAVTAQNIDAFASDAESFFRHSGLAMQGTPQKITMGGLPGLRFRGHRDRRWDPLREHRCVRIQRHDRVLRDLPVHCGDERAGRPGL
jgi:hypothetical protein